MKYIVKVPATSANLGAGFDVMGIALDLYNVFEVEESNSPETILEGFKAEFCNKNNIFYKALIFVLNKYNYKYSSFKIRLLKEDIPIARGLGSSSSCIVGGILIANKILGNKLNKMELVKLATSIEGHPDNVSPAILGGLVVTIVEGDKLYYNKVDIESDIVFSCYIPNFKVSTDNARNILPKSIPLNDAIYNVGHAMLTVLAFMNKNYELLKVSCNDKLHEKYRSKLIEDFDYIKDIFDLHGSIGKFLSGSGPTIIGMFKREDIKNIEEMKSKLLNLNNDIRIINLIVDNKGAQVEER